MFLDIANFFQIWPILAGFEQLGGEFEQIRKEKYFA